MLFHHLEHMQGIHVHSPPLLLEGEVSSIDFDVQKGGFYAGCFDEGMGWTGVE